MVINGEYSKVYPIEKMRQFAYWNEGLEATRTDESKVKEKETDASRSLTENSFVYLHENYMVTNGIFKDKNIVFNSITPEWKDFCIKVLEFKLPIYWDSYS
jgi:hypothetical protein